MADTLPYSAGRAASATTGLRFFWRALPLLALVRLWYAWMLPLVPDEAFYWVWTRHLSTGYLDHPPMIAYLMWLGTHALGPTELGVRIEGVLLSLGATIVIVLLARRVLRDERGWFWVAVIWLVSPVLALTGLVATPDMPAFFFSLCALACAAIIAERDDRAESRSPAALWLLFGLFSGLALLSKYPAILLPAGVALAMLFSAKGRAHFRRPWIYLSGLVALLVFSPVIWWNGHHHWASFLFQLRHGGVADEPSSGISRFGAALRFLIDLSAYIGGQAIVWTPILFAISVIVLISFWRRYQRIRQVDRVLLWTGTLPLLFFAAMYVKSHKGEINWPAFAYFPISLLIGRWLSEQSPGASDGWLKGGCRLAAAFTVVLYVIGFPAITAAILRLPFNKPHNLKDLAGNREEARELARQAASFNAPVVCNHYQDASEAAFYMPGQPDVWCDGIGARPTAFDYFDDQPDFAPIPRILWDGGHADLFCKKHGYRVVMTRSFTRILGPKTTRTLSTAELARDRE